MPTLSHFSCFLNENQPLDPLCQCLYPLFIAFMRATCSGYHFYLVPLCFCPIHNLSHSCNNFFPPLFSLASKQIFIFFSHLTIVPKHPYIRSSKFAWLLLFSHHSNWFECVCIYNLQTLLVISSIFFFIFGIRKFVERGIMWSELSMSLFACVWVCVCVSITQWLSPLAPSINYAISHPTFETCIFFSRISWL